MIDGVHFADHLCVVAVGIGIDGTKHPLGVVEGDTENTTVVKDLLVGLRDRGLDTTKPILCVLDGAKAQVAAVKAVFDHPVVHRYQLHKVRNVESKLPKALASTVAKKMRAAYHDPTRWPPSQTSKLSPPAWPRATPARPGVCGRGCSTPTVTRLGVPPTLRPTNVIESMIEICRITRRT